MAELISRNLNENADELSLLPAEAIVVLVDSYSVLELRLESLRCLDWTLNQQIRRALEKSGNFPIFIPVMNEMKSRIGARYVVLCSIKGDRLQLEKNCERLSLKTVGVVSDLGKIPQEWREWGSSSLDKVFLCE